MLALGGSSQSNNNSLQESSLKSRMVRSKKKKARSDMFQLGGSSAEDENSLHDSIQTSLHRSLLSNSLQKPEQKKQTYFKEEVAAQTIEELSDDVLKTDNGIEESAIDDDESSDWEDSMEESEDSGIDDRLSFSRVEPCRNLTSRQSLITTMLHQDDRAAALQSAALRPTSALQRSRTSQPRGPSDAPFSETDDGLPLTMESRICPGQELPRRTGTQPIIILTTTNVNPPCHPRPPHSTSRSRYEPSHWSVLFFGSARFAAIQ
jgi:hypothetical protein